MSSPNEQDKPSRQDSKPKAGRASTKKKQANKFKKSPNAPKRFKSAFIFFSADRHSVIRQELKDQGINEKTTNIAKHVSEAWKKLTADERVKWEEMAKKDKIRYDAEKAAYQGPWKVSVTHGSTRDPDAPKRPMSAFLAYSNVRRAGLKRKDPTLSNAEVSKILSKKWKELPADERQKYVDEEAERRAKYKEAMKEWREKAAEREELEKQRQEEEEAKKPAAVVADDTRSATELTSADNYDDNAANLQRQLMQQNMSSMNSAGMGTAAAATGMNAMDGMNMNNLNTFNLTGMMGGDNNKNHAMSASAQGMNAGNQFQMGNTNPFSLAGLAAASQQLQQSSYPFDGMSSLLNGTGAFSSAASGYPSSMYQSALLASMQQNQQQNCLPQTSESTLLAMMQQQNQQQLQAGINQQPDPSALLAAMQQNQQHHGMLSQQQGMQQFSSMDNVQFGANQGDFAANGQ